MSTDSNTNTSASKQDKDENDNPYDGIAPAVLPAILEAIDVVVRYTRHRGGKEDCYISESELQWITPSFINFKKRKTKRLSPYSYVPS